MLTRSFSPDIYHLESLPRGYEVYQYRSRPDSTGTKQRVDHYVYGHPFRKPIRSLEQIAQHCQWLATDATQNRRNCACTACENLLSESGKGRSPSAAHNSNGAGPSNSGDQSGNSSVAA